MVDCVSIVCHLPMALGDAFMLLGERHKKAGVVCEECHQGEISEGNATKVDCFRCHIGYLKLAERTSKITPNPHKSHMGNLECIVCHHIHKASEDYCGECHNIGFKVP